MVAETLITKYSLRVKWRKWMYLTSVFCHLFIDIKLGDWFLQRSIKYIPKKERL